MTSQLMTDFPKLHCPFVREIFDVDRADFKKFGSQKKLRNPEVYLVTTQVNPGYEWVFEDPDTIAVEKLDGTNVKIKTEGGRLVAVQNRLNVIDPLQIIKGNTSIIEGIFRAIDKDYINENGEQVGELIGPKLQGNPYKLEMHLWYPFEKTIKNLSYRSFGEHARTFENWSSWFLQGLKSRLHTKMVGIETACFAEGVIFYNLKRKAEGKSYMAKLRRDMFSWYYEPEIKISNYNIAGGGRRPNGDVD